MFTLIPTNQFKKDLKLVNKRSSKLLIETTVFLEKLEQNGAEGIAKKYRPHKLILE